MVPQCQDIQRREREENAGQRKVSRHGKIRWKDLKLVKGEEEKEEGEEEGAPGKSEGEREYFPNSNIDPEEEEVLLNQLSLGEISCSPTIR